MPPSNASIDWSELADTMSERFGTLADQVLINLESLLESGRRAVNCAETALLVPDADGTHLRFLVSLNSKPGIADIVKQISVPRDGSIVGCVFNTGQLIAIANPEDFYQQVDRKTGLTTQIYLATPVVSADEVVGVATFVNRPEGQPPEPFNEAEIEASMRMAELAASGLRFYQRVLLQQDLLRSELTRVAEQFSARDGGGEDLFEHQWREAEVQAPLARVTLGMERLSQDDQELAARLIDVLASRHDSELTDL